MKKNITMKKLLVLISCMALMYSTHAQTKAQDLVKEWQRAKAYTKEYLDAMPESGYAYTPNPEIRSFAAQMLHLSDAIYGIIGSATDEKPSVGMGALEKSKDENKASVSAKVLAAYDFAIMAIQKLAENKWNEQIKLFGRFELSREMAIAKCFEHQTHHRGQTTVYLRMQGVKPPAEKLF